MNVLEYQYNGTVTNIVNTFDINKTGDIHIGVFELFDKHIKLYEKEIIL